MLRIAVVYDWRCWWGAGHPPDVLEREDAGTFAGGETHLLEGALGLAEAGHEVTLFADLIRPCSFRGVTFRPARDFLKSQFYEEQFDAVLAYMQPGPLLAVSRDTARIFVQQCNDFTFRDGWWGVTDAIVAASVSHAKYLASLQDKNRRPYYTGPYEVVHNGCFLRRYPERPPAPETRAATVAYWSSPDRGLHHLIDAWPLVVRERPDAKLTICYEVERAIAQADALPKGSLTDPGISRLTTLKTAIGQAKRIPSIHFTGMLPRPALARIQLATRVMCYPLDASFGYTEGMGSSVVEAMAAGALPLITPRDCFPSVYRGAARFIEGDPRTPGFSASLAQQIIAALDWRGDADPTLAALRARAERYTWANMRTEMVRVVERVLARKRGLSEPPPAFELELLSGG